MKYCNQKHIKIQKTACDSEKIYAKINISAMQSAMKDLSKIGAMKLWLYLSKNQPNYEFDLSYGDCSNWGMTESSYHNAVKELIERRYLISIGKNCYIFKENPSEN